MLPNDLLWKLILTDPKFRERVADAIFANAGDGDEPDNTVVLDNARIVFEQMEDEANRLSHN